MRKKFSVLALVLVVTLLIVWASHGQMLSIATSYITPAPTRDGAPQFDTMRVTKLSDTGDVTFLAAGDIANCNYRSGFDDIVQSLEYSFNLSSDLPSPNEGMIATAKLFDQYPGAYILPLGDLAYRRGSPASFRNCYDPYWGQVRNRTWPTPGNHEYYSLNAYGYYDYWQQRAGPDRRGYYAIKAPGWTLISLNSEIDAAPGSAQLDWLQSVLGEASGTCVGAFFHKTAYSAAEGWGNENAVHLFTLLNKYNAAFVLNGHHHFYERTVALNSQGQPDPSGIVTFVVGTGGKRSTRQIDKSPYSGALEYGLYGALKLTLSQTDYAWDFISMPGNIVLDRGKAACNRS